MATVQSTLNWGEQIMREKNFPEPSQESAELLSQLLNCSKSDLYVRSNDPVNLNTHHTFTTLLSRRLAYEPVAYLVNKKNFMGRDFYLDSRVLIPRPETELLVEKVLELATTLKSHPRILEMGTGSGCIALSLALERPDVEVVATDISPEALAVARLNAARFGLEKKVRFLQSNLYEKTEPGLWSDFDMIVSNPPYILSSEFNSLDPDLRYEPLLALDGGRDGLAVIRPLLSGAHAVLKKGGFVCLEIGAFMGPPVLFLFQELGFTKAEIFKDYQAYDRIVVGQWER